MIRVACPCACAWRVKDALAGKRIHCPICGRIVTVPGKLREAGGKKADAKAKPSLPPNIWYIQTSHGEIGPMHIVQVARAAWMGKIGRSTHLRRSGSDIDILAGDLVGIFPDEPAEGSKPASTEDLTDWLAELAKQASQGDIKEPKSQTRRGGTPGKAPPRGAAAKIHPRPKVKPAPKGAKVVKPGSQPDATGPSDGPHIWYIQTPKGEMGPIHIVQVAKAAWMGKINRNTHLRRSGSVRIIPAGDLAGIFPDAPAPKRKPAPLGELTDDLTDYLAGLAEQASQGNAPAPAEADKTGGTLTALLAAQRSGADEADETDEKTPPKSQTRHGGKAAKSQTRPGGKKAAAKEKTSKSETRRGGKASRKRGAAKTVARAKAKSRRKAGKTSGPKAPAADKKPKPPAEEAPQKKPPPKAADRRATLKALADTLSGEETPDVAKIEAAGAVEAQALDEPDAAESRLEELQNVPSDRSGALSRARAHWDELAALAMSPEFFAKTSAIVLGAAMLMTIVIPWGVKDGTFLMSWEILQEASAGPVLLLVGAWVAGLAVVLAGALLGRLTLSVSALALSAIALAMVLLSGDVMLQLAPWLATVQPLLRKVVPAAAGLLLMVQMAATHLRLREDDSVALRLAQRLGGGGMALLAAVAVVLLILDYTGLEQGPRKDLFFDFLFFLMLWICLLIAGVLADMQTILRARGPKCGRVSLWMGYVAVVATIVYVIGRPAQKAGPSGSALPGVNLCLLVAAPWWLGKFALEATMRGLRDRLAATAESDAPPQPEQAAG